MRSKWLALLLLIASYAPAQDYKIAQPGYTFAFPRDYFNHEEYQTEWWYYTGNVMSSDGHPFGFELTFFRQGVSRADSSHPWFVHDLWMAHMALSDITGQRFYTEERLNRAGPGIAGVDAQTGMLWNGNWQSHITEQEQALRGVAGKFGFALNLKPVKQPVIQGQNGVSQKGEGAGHASHYFSLTRLLTTGSIDLDGKTYQVEGTSWMDHEFFSGSMAANEVGWDWLSVQLEDGTELMLYRLRHKDGSIDPYSSGSYVNANGTSRFLSTTDFAMTPAADSDSANHWTSPATKATYPLQWHISIPRLKLELDITTPLRSQELASRFGTSYWEGAIDAAGTRDQSRLRGTGYLEMTGYAETGRPVIPR
jgi:predicted secreted hydrolase